MNQNNLGLMSTSPNAVGPNTAPDQQPTTPRSRWTKLKAFTKAAFIVLAGVTAAPAIAQTPINSTVTCTQATTATTSCVNGFYASGWTSGNGYWTYNLNTTGFTGITMEFNTSSSGTGPNAGAVYYNTGVGPDVFVGNYTVGSCALKTINLPAACEGIANLSVKLKMTGATNAGGTNRVPNNGVFEGTNASGCSGTPVAGTVTGTTNTICGSGSVTLTLTGAASGSGIAYQWQSSPAGTPSWTNISGATGISYTTVVSTSSQYRVVTTCSGASPATSAAYGVTVNPLPTVAAITNVPTTPLLTGATVDLDNATSGGVWTSSNNSIATVNTSGLVTAVSGGTAVISYKVTNLSTSCEQTVTANVNIVWPNTLALYAGYNGSNTNVIAIPGETTGALTATNFTVLDTPSTLCGSGGLSGLNILPSVTAYSTSGPYVSYTITPDAGKALNFYRIHARTRESDSGATKARIAYRINGGAWIDENRDVTQNTGGSCGAGSNAWDFTLAGANPTVNGITTSLEVAVFPYAPYTKYGTFQLNSLEVYGTVTTSTPCSGTPNGGTIAPTSANICDSGSRWLNFTGDAGVGITYQWESSNNGTTWSNVAGATGASYNTGMLYAGVSAPLTYYRVKTTCSGSGLSAYSALDTITVNSTANAGTITAASFLKIGTPVTLTSTISGGYWRSNDTSVVTIDSASGLATPMIPGDAVITYAKVTNGCTARSRDTVNVVFPNTIAAYIGKNGRSLNVTPAAGYTVSNLVSNYDTTTRCGNGGLSGLKNDLVTSYDANGKRASFTLTVGGLGAGNTIDINGFHVTTRRSNSGVQKVTLAYSIDGGISWTDDLFAHDVLADDCGYSSEVTSFDESIFQLPGNLANGAVVEFAVYGYDPIANGGTLQINAIDITASGSPSVIIAKPLALGAITNAADAVSVYPNPATHTLNITANDAVNVSVMSIDGRKLMTAEHATSVDVSKLSPGMYLVQIYNAATNSLLKTTKFTKQ